VQGVTGCEKDVGKIAFPTLVEDFFFFSYYCIFVKDEKKNTNKPIRMDFLSIFLSDFRGPRKAAFRLKITGA